VRPPRFGFFFWPYEPGLVARMVRLGEEQGWDLVGIADTPGNLMFTVSLAADPVGTVELFGRHVLRRWPGAG
jgi:hypothetical protein